MRSLHPLQACLRITTICEGPMPWIPSLPCHPRRDGRAKIEKPPRLSHNLIGTFLISNGKQLLNNTLSLLLFMTLPDCNITSQKVHEIHQNVKWVS
jgi:hypothetical protein